MSKYIPLVTALMIVAHTLFLKSGNLTFASYLSAFLISSIISTPYFLSVYFLAATEGFKRFLILLAVFIFYPVLILAIQNHLIWSEQFLLSVDEFAIFFAFYFFANIRDWLLKLPLIQASKQMKNSVTLFGVILFILISGSILISFILSSDPKFSEVNSHSFTLNIDSGLISVSRFFSLLLQFLFISSLFIGVYYINSRYLIKYILSRHGVFVFFCSLIICTLILTPIFFSLIMLLPISNVELFTLLSEPLSINHKNNYKIVLATFLFFSPLILLFEKQKQATEIKQLSQEKKRSEMLMLQQQVNPHFLFNTLNNIYAHSLSNSDKTPKLISRLSNMLRYTVYEGQKNKVSLSDEIQFLKNFVELQKLRTRDNLTLITTWPEQEELPFCITPLLLIIILENAFKHSIEKTANNCSIEMNISIENSWLTLTCDNTYISRGDDKNDTGLGLVNLQKRLDIIYPNKHELTLGKVGELWKVKLSIELTV